jgi:hypothetical protein
MQGLVLSSAATGLFFASLGFTADVARDTARGAAAALMAAAGVTLLVARLQAVVAIAASPLASAAAGITRRLPAGLGGQFLSGLLDPLSPRPIHCPGRDRQHTAGRVAGADRGADGHGR